MEPVPTLYATDLDGTLLHSSDQRASDYTVRVFRELARRGELVTAATARSQVTTVPRIQPLQLTAPVVIVNGAFEMNPDSHDLDHGMFHTPTTVQYVVDTAREAGIAPLVYRRVEDRDVVEIEWESDAVRAFVARRPEDERLAHVESFHHDDVFYINCITDREHAPRLRDALRDLPSEAQAHLQIDVYHPEDIWVEVTAASATKAKGLERVAREVGADRLVVFGDNLNDIPMFRAADEAYAVENAVPELKAIATAVIASNDDDGVAHWLDDNVLGGAVAALDHDAYRDTERTEGTPDA